MKKENKYLKLDAIKFGIAWGVVAAMCVFLTTLVAIIGWMPQYSNWATNILKMVYGYFGYKVGLLGILLGPIYSFIDVFIMSWLFALIYNKLVRG